MFLLQIGDIVVGQDENVSAREALLRWARRSTAKYPGVRVSDFTSSWRDGLAFNALIHRNRPDLVDWRSIRSRVARERLEMAFHVAEREYGVTRLLDPEGKHLAHSSLSINRQKIAVLLKIDILSYSTSINEFRYLRHPCRAKPARRPKFPQFFFWLVVHRNFIPVEKSYLHSFFFSLSGGGGGILYIQFKKIDYVA